MLGCERIRYEIILTVSVGVPLLFPMSFARGEDVPGRVGGNQFEGQNKVAVGKSGDSPYRVDLEFLIERSRRIGQGLIAWYGRTPPPDRVIWGGLTACAGLGLSVLLERVFRLRTRRIVPADFTARFLDRLHEGETRLRGGARSLRAEPEPGGASRVGGGPTLGTALGRFGAGRGISS